PPDRRESYEHRDPPGDHRGWPGRHLLPRRVRSVPHLRPDGRAELRPRRLPVPRCLPRLRDLPAARRHDVDRLRRLAAGRCPGGGGLRRGDRAGPGAEALQPAHRTGARHGRSGPRGGRALRRHLGHRPAVHQRTGVAGRHHDDRWRQRAERPVRRHHRRRRRPRLDRPLPQAHPLRHDHPRRGREPVDGHRPGHRRAHRLHAGLHDRRCRRRPRWGAGLALLRLRLAPAGPDAADLRLHRHRHRWPRLTGRSRPGIRHGRPAAAVRQLLPGRHRRFRRRPAAGRGAPDPALRPDGEEDRMTAVDTQRPEADRTREVEPEADVKARLIGLIFPVGLVVLLACLPLLNLSLPGVLPGPTYTPGTLHLLALAMVMAALAVSYHLLFGVAGLLSFGHALYFGLGAYGLGIVMEELELGIVPAAVLVIVAGILLSTLLGAVSLQVSGIPFAMVTLAFAQAGFVLVRKDPGRLTGGEEGLRLPTDYVPDWLVGVADTRNLYWVALAALVDSFVHVTWVQ